MRKIKTKIRNMRGFTLVELALSMALIGVLSLTIALIITNSISSYQQGMMLNQLNTVGMDLVQDMQSSIRRAPIRSVTSECGLFGIGNSYVSVSYCETNNGKQLVFYEKKDSEGRGRYGAFCPGSYSYVWQRPKKSGEPTVKFSYRVGASNKDIEGFRLLKVQDPSRSVCVMANAYDGFGSTERPIVLGEPQELLAATNSSISFSVYDMEVAAPAYRGSADSLFYSVSFVLGTSQSGGIDIDNQRCRGNREGDSNFNYCAINKFNFATMATGE